jgi:hypothetical protein
MSYINQTTFRDSPQLDSYGNLNTVSPYGTFDAQFTYDLQPLLFEQITNGTGATVTFDSTNRCALMTFASTPTGGKAFMQSYQFQRYQPGKAHLIKITYNFVTQTANVLKFAGYSDGTNGIEFQNNGTTNQFVIYNGGTLGNQTVVQASWNVDKFDGTGPSGLTLDITKLGFFVIDMQALYSGRVRCGFNIGGTTYWAHYFNHANLVATQFLQNANLPIRCGMTCTGTVSTTMNFICASVSSEGGQEITHGYEFEMDGVVNVPSGTPIHVCSVRPKALFNGIVNRGQVYMLEFNSVANGANPVYWEVLLGQAITGTTTFNDVNTTYSISEFNKAGTLSGSPAIFVDGGYTMNSSKGEGVMEFTTRYPITLDAAGVARLLGTITIQATGVTGVSNNFYWSLKISEIR